MTAGAFGAGIYCYVLSLRLRRLQTLEGGLGGAIAVLSAQVDDMTRALAQARDTAEQQGAALEALTHRGEAAAARLELLLASLHDLPQAGAGTDDRRLRVVRRRAGRDSWEEAAE